MAEPPWPPPDDERPYDWKRDDHEMRWGGDPEIDWGTYAALVAALICLAIALVILLSLKP